MVTKLAAGKLQQPIAPKSRAGLARYSSYDAADGDGEAESQGGSPGKAAAAAAAAATPAASPPAKAKASPPSATPRHDSPTKAKTVPLPTADLPHTEGAKKAKSSANLAPPQPKEVRSAIDIQRIERGRSTRNLVAGLKAAKSQGGMQS
jgi:hypothetical protein